jgi:hypothetical protein
MSENEKLVQNITSMVYAARKMGNEKPEGMFDNQRRWYPNARENASGDGSFAKPPTHRLPGTYFDRCLTRKHCKTLVIRFLAGIPVPRDVENAARFMSTHVVIGRPKFLGVKWIG